MKGKKSSSDRASQSEEKKILFNVENGSFPILKTHGGVSRLIFEPKPSKVSCEFLKDLEYLREETVRETTQERI